VALCKAICGLAVIEMAPDVTPALGDSRRAAEALRATTAVERASAEPRTTLVAARRARIEAETASQVASTTRVGTESVRVAAERAPAVPAILPGAVRARVAPETAGAEPSGMSA
jgi:hypothetical protein